MKYLFTILLFTILLSLQVNAQKLWFEISSTQGYAITLDQLNDAKQLADLKKDYPSSWIAQDDYKSSNIAVSTDGKELMASGNNDKLTEEQMSLIKQSKIGSIITISVDYQKRNDITQKYDPFTMNFSLTVIPDHEAQFISTEENIDDYINQNLIKDLSMRHQEIILKKPIEVEFTVLENGKIRNAIIQEYTEDIDLNKLIIEKIQTMPSWKPATMKDGSSVTQKIYFRLGNMGC